MIFILGLIVFLLIPVSAFQTQPRTERPSTGSGRLYMKSIPDGDDELLMNDIIDLDEAFK